MFEEFEGMPKIELKLFVLGFLSYLIKNVRNPLLHVIPDPFKQDGTFMFVLYWLLQEAMVNGQEIPFSSNEINMEELSEIIKDKMGGAEFKFYCLQPTDEYQGSQMESCLIYDPRIQSTYERMLKVILRKQ